ncbi:MAG: J domain-containing protein [Elusimicrobia bacterium]|nr:J domain-containing protein [Elusimicrobiota bacterium]
MLSILWHGGRSSEQLAKKLGLSLYAIGKACAVLKQVNMVHRENDMWRMQYRDGKAKKIVGAGEVAVDEVLSTYKRKARNSAFLRNQKAYHGKKGSREEWRAGATLLVTSGDEYRKYLEVLGLTGIPTAKQLKDAWKSHMKLVHPDVGGSTQDAILVNEAYKRLSELIGK